MNMIKPIEIECLDCGARVPYLAGEQACPQCGGGWREARYDLPAIAPVETWDVEERRSAVGSGCGRL